MSMKITFNYS